MITREDFRTLKEARKQLVSRLQLSKWQRRRLTIPMVNQLVNCADDEACRLVLLGGCEPRKKASRGQQDAI